MPYWVAIILKSLITIATLKELMMIKQNVKQARKTNKFKPSMIALYIIMTMTLVCDLFLVWIDTTLLETQKDFWLFTAKDELDMATKLLTFVLVQFVFIITLEQVLFIKQINECTVSLLTLSIITKKERRRVRRLLIVCFIFDALLTATIFFRYEIAFKNNSGERQSPTEISEICMFILELLSVVVLFGYFVLYCLSRKWFSGEKKHPEIF